MEAQVAQNLRAKPIAQADILKSDHAVLRKTGIVIRARGHNLAAK